MFAAKVAKPQTKAEKGWTSKRATASLTTDQSSGDHKQELPPEHTLAREVPRGVSWDFSKISLYPTDRPSRREEPPAAGGSGQALPASLRNQFETRSAPTCPRCGCTQA